MYIDSRVVRRDLEKGIGADLRLGDAEGDAPRAGVSCNAPNTVDASDVYIRVIWTSEKCGRLENAAAVLFRGGCSSQVVRADHSIRAGRTRQVDFDARQADSLCGCCRVLVDEVALVELGEEGKHRLRLALLHRRTRSDTATNSRG